MYVMVRRRSKAGPVLLVWWEILGSELKNADNLSDANLPIFARSLIAKSR